ncbi:MAG TPA: hypothetical protein VGD80_44745, partial [Kofleriaceae bacterium]
MVATSPAAEPAIEPYRSSSEHLRDELARIDLLVRGQVFRARQASGDDPYRGLVISEAEVDALLARAPGVPPWDAATAGPSLADARAFADRIAGVIASRCERSTASLRLVQLAQRFALDRFALDVVMLALAPELDLRYERLYAYLHDDIHRKRPSVDLALNLLCGSLDERLAARARFTATSPLVRHGLIRVLGEPDAPLLARPIKLDDRIVNWLHGSDDLAPRLAPHAHRIAPSGALADLVADTDTRDRLRSLAGSADHSLVVYLLGPAGAGKRTTAEALVCELARGAAPPRALVALDAASLDGLSDDATAEIVLAAVREARLADDVLLVEHADLLLAGERRIGRTALLDAIPSLPSPVIL